MEQTRATRTDLLARKSQVALARQGAKLLKSKREALLKELMRLVKPLLSAHEEVTEKAQHAARSLTLAEALDGEPYLRSLALASGRQVRVDFEEQAFWGVRVAKLQPNLTRDGQANRRPAPSGITASSDEATRDFEALLASLLELAPLQLRLSRLGAEVRKTSRRVNALDQVVVPNLEQDIKTISQALGEIEREDLFRLRRIKKKKGKVL